MPRRIEVSDGQVDHVRKRVQMAEATGPVFDDLYDAIESFSNSVGHAGVDEGQHGVLVAPEGMDELAQRLQATEQGALGPLLQEPLCRPGCLVGPEVLELFFQAPGAMIRRLCLSSALRLRVSRRVRVDEWRESSQRIPLSALRSSRVASRHCSLRTSSTASLSALTIWKRSSTRVAFGQCVWMAPM